VHHGNGTQDLFAGDARVLYASVHQAGSWPGTGSPDGNPPPGCPGAHNVEMAPGAGGEAFRSAWTGLLAGIDAFAPQLVMVSAGFDAHRDDPVAELCVEAADYAWIGAALAGLARRHADGRIVSVLEGGYHLDALASSCAAYVRALAGDGGVPLHRPSIAAP
jgi:acetoin utilization deacetylase AcuC-like enzyme